jgi:hypothetical protein
MAKYHSKLLDISIYVISCPHIAIDLRMTLKFFLQNILFDTAFSWNTYVLRICVSLLRKSADDIRIMIFFSDPLH